MTRYNCQNLHTGQHVLFAWRGFVGFFIALFQAKFRMLRRIVRTHAGTLVAEKWIKVWHDKGLMNVRPQHVALLTEQHDPERWWVFEALPDGCWLTPLDEHLRNGERIKVREVPLSYPAPPGWKERLAEFCARVSGLWLYSFRYLLKNAAYEIFGAPSADPAWFDGLSDEELARRVMRFMCSQANSFLSLRFRGVDTCPKLAHRATGPDDLDADAPKCVLVTVCEQLKIVEA